MISRLINIKPINFEINKSHSNTALLNAGIRDYAKCFIAGMSDTQLTRFKKMLENNIECGRCIADTYGVDYTLFITEVKKELNVEV